MRPSRMYVSLLVSVRHRGTHFTSAVSHKHRHTDCS